MDEFLQPNALYNRLLHKYKKHGRLVIAVDFDHTLHSKYPERSYDQVQQLVRDLHNAGMYILIFTGNRNTAFIRNFLFKNNIHFDSINTDAPFIPIEDIGRKPFFNCLLDDRSGLICTFNALTALLKTINDEKLD